MNDANIILELTAEEAFVLICLLAQLDAEPDLVKWLGGASDDAETLDSIFQQAAEEYADATGEEHPLVVFEDEQPDDQTDDPALCAAIRVIQRAGGMVHFGAGGNA